MRSKRVRALAVGAAATVTGLLALPTQGGADPAVASATLVDINGRQVGRALFTATEGGDVRGRVSVVIDNAVTGNPSEFHGFHIHANNDDDNGDGDTNDGCVTHSPATTPAASARFTEVDGHWDTDSPSAHGAHTGDLPSLMRQRDGEATLEFTVDKYSAGDLPGRAIVVHFLADDFGKHPTIGTSATTGNAGARYACGVIVATARG